MPRPALPGLRNAGLDPLAENLALKLSEDRQHPGQRESRGRGEIQRFLQRDKPYAQGLSFVQRADEVR